MKRILQIVALAASLAALAACDNPSVSVSGGEQTPASQTQGMNAGNWKYIASVTEIPPVVFQGNINPSFTGILTGSSGTVTLTSSLNVQVIPSGASFPVNCVATANPLVYTGTVSGDSVTLTSQAVAGSSTGIVITGTVFYGTNFSGSYQITGAKQSDDCYGATGTVYGYYLPPFPAGATYWSGSVVEASYDDNQQPILNGYGKYTNTAGIEAYITRGDTPDANFHYPLSGNIIYTDSLCYSTGTIDAAQSYDDSGLVTKLVVNTDTGVTFSMSAVAVDPSRPTERTLFYVVPSGACQYYQVTGNMTQADPPPQI
ncbi:MAG: hypothetical protein WAN35_16340 [Terracidiphilus sp.]